MVEQDIKTKILLSSVFGRIGPDLLPQQLFQLIPLKNMVIILLDFKENPKVKTSKKKLAKFSFPTISLKLSIWRAKRKIIC